MRWPVAVQAVKQTKLSLDAIKNSVSSVDELGKKTNSIITSILSIIAKLSGG